MEMTVIHGLSTNPTDKEDTCTDCVGVIFLFCEFSGSMVLRNSQLMLKNIIQHSPTNNIFFRNFALDSQTQRVGNSESVHITKVLLKFYLLKSNFANLNFHGDKVGNSTCIGCLFPAENGRLYSKIGVGLLFYPWNR